MNDYNNNLAEVSSLVYQANEAVNKLEEYTNKQTEISKKNILSQVCDYIYETLSTANWIFYGTRLFDSIHLNSSGVLYVGRGGYIPCMNPVARITRDRIKPLNNINEDELMMLIYCWNSFKKQFHEDINESIRKKQIEVNKKISHIAYVQEKIERFEV